MKKYIKELVIISIQLLLFYIGPLLAKPIGPIGMVSLLILFTLVLSVMLSIISQIKIKYFYPIITSLLFIPSVFIYYNESALVHSVWYFIISLFGLVLGNIIYKTKNN